MTVVVTGANGHLGANVVRALLDRGEQVRVLVHRSRAAVDALAGDFEPGQLEAVEGSVLELESLRRAFEGARRVFHLAGVISIDGDPDGWVRRVNVDGTANVAQACREVGVGRMLHVSSVHAFEQRPRDQILDEGRPRVEDSPAHSAYDRSKAAGERAVLDEVDAGLDAVLVNPTGIVGPDDYGPSRMGKLLCDLAAGRVPALLDGGFDFVDVRDVTASVLAAAEPDRADAGESFILGNAWYSLRELGEAVARVTGRRPPRLVTPVWAARLGVPFARAVARLRSTDPLFTRESLDVLVSNRSISSEKARRRLGHAPRPLQDTVADTLAWFEQRGRIRLRRAA